MVGRVSALVLFCLILAGVAYAQPGIPHQFYGTVTVNGAPADGATVVAEVNGVGRGSVLSINGNYGYDPNIFYVEDPTGSYAASKPTIEFFVNGTSAATYPFETGGYTELNLSIGSAPSNPPSQPGGAPLGGSGPSGGGGSTNRLDVDVEGKCVGQETVVTVLNSVGNPAREADVKAVKDRQTVEQQESDDDGKAFFTFSEAGEYYFYVTKTNYSQTTKKVDIVECTGQEAENVEAEGSANLCENVDCDDQNPCTTEYCAAATGHCVFENQPEDLSCGGGNTCQQGVCAEPVSEEEGEGEVQQGLPTGFFGLNFGQAGGAGLVVIALVGLVLLFAGKRKKKKK